MNRRLTNDLDWPLLGAVGIAITIAMIVYYNVLSPDQRHHIEAAGVLLALLAMFACLVIDYRTLVPRSGYICVVIVLLVTGLLFLWPVNRRVVPPWMAPAHPLYPFYSWLGVSDSWLARKIRRVFRFRYRHKSPCVVQVQC